MLQDKHKFKIGDVVEFDLNAPINKSLEIDGLVFVGLTGVITRVYNNDNSKYIEIATDRPDMSGSWFAERFKLSVPTINDNKLKSRLGLYD